MFKWISVLQLGLGLFSFSAVADEAYVIPKNLNQLQIDELMNLIREPKFPDMKIEPVDPLSLEKMDAVKIGPTFKSTSDSDFDYYRYVTFYDIDTRKEQVALPVQREHCWNKSEVFANYTFTYNRTASGTASVSIQGLGFDASISESKGFQVSQNVTAVGGIEANHVPYFIKADWSGRTFIQTFNSKTGKVAFVLKKSKDSSWFLNIQFPALSHTKYPMDFKIKDAVWTFDVEREDVVVCSGSTKKGKPTQTTKLKITNLNMKVSE